MAINTNANFPSNSSNNVFISTQESNALHNYAMSQGAMAIIIDDIKEGEKIAKFLCSSVFNKIIKACLWSSFRIEWGMFKDLKKNFYELLDDKKIENNKIIEQDNIKNKIITVITKTKILKSKIKTKITNEDNNDNEFAKIINDELNDFKVSKSSINIISDNVILDETPEFKNKKIIKKKIKTNTDINIKL